MMNKCINLNSNNYSLLSNEINNYMGNSQKAYLIHRSQNFGTDNTIKAEIEKSRIQLAKLLNSNEQMLFFEGDSARTDAGIISAITFYLNIQVIVTVASENENKLDFLKCMDHAGIIKLIILEPDNTGKFDINALISLLNYNDLKKLVSISHANRINGELVPVKEIAQACKKSGSFFHLNTSLTIGKYLIDFTTLSPDFMSFGSYLLHGPEGIGAIIMHPEIKIEKENFNLIYKHLVSTECNNLALISGLEKSVGLSIDDIEFNNKKIGRIKEYFTKKIKEILYIEPVNLKTSKTGLINLVPIPIRPSRFGQYLKEKFDESGFAIDDLYKKNDLEGEEIFILPLALNEEITESEIDTFINILQQMEKKD